MALSVHDQGRLGVSLGGRGGSPGSSTGVAWVGDVIPGPGAARSPAAVAPSNEARTLGLLPEYTHVPGRCLHSRTRRLPRPFEASTSAASAGNNSLSSSSWPRQGRASGGERRQQPLQVDNPRAHRLPAFTAWRHPPFPQGFPLVC